MKTKVSRKKDDKYYVPTCREFGCDGNLIISIDEYLFQVNCFCEKNNNHKYQLYFDTFDKFYLKEKKMEKCSRCFNNINNRDICICNKCNKLYCFGCFRLDKHIKENFDNLNIISHVYKKDDYELTKYCIDCGKKLYPYCLKSYLDNNHNGHKIINISQHYPPNELIKELLEKLTNKSKYYENLIKSLDEWQIQLNKKIEQ